MRGFRVSLGWRAGCHAHAGVGMLPVLLLAGLVSTPARGADAPARTGPQFVRVRVGIAQRYKLGLWTSVELTIRGGSQPLTGRVAVTVPDDEGGPSRFTTPDEAVHVEPGRETTVRLRARFGRAESTLLAEFHAGGRIAAHRVFNTAKAAADGHYLPALEANQDLLLVIGAADAMGVDDAVFGREFSAESKAVVERLERIDQLPTDWQAMEGIRAILLSGSRPEVYEKLTADDPHLQCLNRWIREGGVLLASAGAKADQVFGPHLPLAQLMPGRVERTMLLHQTVPLESYAGVTNLPIIADNEIRVPQLVDVDGAVESREADLPLVVRTARGFGQIVVLAADLDQLPLSRWKGRGMLVTRLLQLPAVPTDDATKSHALMHFGVIDVGGQLRKALDQVPGVDVVPFWLVALLIGGYAVLIGPADYFFLRRIVGRMTWTWLTFPAIVVGVSMAAYALAHRFKGNQSHVQQADLIDVDAAAGTMRGTTWASIFSPRTEAYDLAARPIVSAAATAPASTAQISWHGLAGSGLGGMSPRTISFSPWAEPYDVSAAADQLRGFPIQAWSSRSVTACWRALAASPVRADLTDEGQALAGTLTNTLPCPVTRCLLAYGYWAYDLGTVAPGQTVRVGAATNRDEFRSYLTGRTLVYDQQHDRHFQGIAPYDRSSVDIPYILRMLSFFDAAGGTPYTGLLNGSQSMVDMSPLLKADRAILIALAGDSPALPGTQLLRSGQPLTGAGDARVTVLRVVFPLKKIEGPKPL